MGHSVLLVPVPALEDFVRSRTAHYDTDYLSSDPRFTHAHITALGPFLPHTDERAAARIAEIASSTPAFDFELARIATFANGIIHLVPDPEAPFRELTARLAAEFPQCPPYADEFPDTRPHLTLDARSATVSEQSTRTLLGAAIPVTTRAERLDLAWYAAGGCSVLDSWPLGV